MEWSSLAIPTRPTIPLKSHEHSSHTFDAFLIFVFQGTIIQTPNLSKFKDPSYESLTLEDINFEAQTRDSSPSSLILLFLDSVYLLDNLGVLGSLQVVRERSLWEFRDRLLREALTLVAPSHGGISG